MLGQLLLHYRVVEKISEGGQVTVYKVFDTTIDRRAVIKVIPPDLTDSASNLARFEREAKLASSRDHPNIWTFGLHKLRNVHFIAMQFVEGGNVRAIVDRKFIGPLPDDSLTESCGPRSWNGSCSCCEGLQWRRSANATGKASNLLLLQSPLLVDEISVTPSADLTES